MHAVKLRQSESASRAAGQLNSGDIPVSMAGSCRGISLLFWFFQAIIRKEKDIWGGKKIPPHTLFTRCCCCRCPLVGGEAPTRNTGSCSQILSETPPPPKKRAMSRGRAPNQQSPCAPAILSGRSTLLLPLPWPPNWQTRVSSISSVDRNYRRICSNTLLLYWSLSTGAATEPNWRRRRKKKQLQIF